MTNADSAREGIFKNRLLDTPSSIGLDKCPIVRCAILE